MVASCIITDCEVIARFIKICIVYFFAFIVICFTLFVIFCAMNKARFLFYRCWKTINERSDELKPTFSNAKKIAQITWSELYYTQRQIERSRAELSQELSSIEAMRRHIQKDISRLSALPNRRQVYFVEPRRSGSSTTSSSSRTSVGKSTTC